MNLNHNPCRLPSALREALADESEFKRTGDRHLRFIHWTPVTIAEGPVFSTGTSSVIPHGDS